MNSLEFLQYQTLWSENGKSRELFRLYFKFFIAKKYEKDKLAHILNVIL